MQHVKAAGQTVGRFLAPVSTAFRAIGFGLSRPGQAVEHAISQVIHDTQTDSGSVADVLHAAWQGLSGQAQDTTGAQIMHQLGIHNKLAADVAGFATDVLTDPLTYVPVAKLAELAKVPELFNLAYRGAKQLPIAKDLIDYAGQVFDRYHGTSPEFKAGWQQMEGRNAAAEQETALFVKRAFQGAAPEVRQAYTHAKESGNIPAQLAAIHAMVAPEIEKYGQQAAQRGLIRGLMPNYMPHILAQRFQQGYGIWSNIKAPMRAFTPSSIGRKLEGTIAEINARMAKDPEYLKSRGLDPNGKFFEDDAAKIAYAHLLQLRQAINMHDFLQGVVSRATKFTSKSQIPLVLPDGMGLYRPNSLKFFRALMASPDAVDVAEEGAKVVPLEELHAGLGVGRGPVYMMRKAEADWLNGALRYRGPMHGIARAAEAVRGLTLRLMLINPFVHFPHNVLWNSYLRDPGAVLNPAEWAQHIPGVIHGIESDPWLKRATEAGAVPTSAVLDYRGPIAHRANEVAADLTKTKARRILENLTPFAISQHATWVPENAMRAALFRRAAQKGMTDAGAANWVNEALGNHRNLSNAEREVQRFLLPFYNWERTAITFNLGQMYRHTNRSTIPLHVLNAINEATAGHPMSMNPDGKQFDLQLGPDKAGNQRFLNIYNPLLETLGVGERGAPSYIFNRSRPEVRAFGQGVTGLSNPLAGPQANYPFDKYPDLTGKLARLNDVPLFQAHVPVLNKNIRGPEVNPETATIAQQVLSLPGRYAPAAPLGPGMQTAQAAGMFPIIVPAGSQAKKARSKANKQKQELRYALQDRARAGLPLVP